MSEILDGVCVMCVSAGAGRLAHREVVSRRCGVQARFHGSVGAERDDPCVGTDEITGLDIATAIVAGYAALIATGALAFQIISWLLSHQTRVKVDLRAMRLLEPGAQGRPAVIFDLKNRSPHRVKVTHVGLRPLYKGGPASFIAHPLPLPAPGVFEIPAHDGVQVYIWCTTITDGQYDPDWKTRAMISTSDGASFESKGVRVRDLLIAESA